MSLVRLVYTSRVDRMFNEVEAREILKVSRENNRAAFITGVLTFDNAHFLQCLEGARDTVNRLYSYIIQDPRHHQVTLLLYEEAQERVFNDWYMGFIPPTALTRELILRYSATDEFDPLGMRGANALAMLRELSAYTVK